MRASWRKMRLERGRAGTISLGARHTIRSGVSCRFRTLHFGPRQRKAIPTWPPTRGQRNAAICWRIDSERAPKTQGARLAIEMPINFCALAAPVPWNGERFGDHAERQSQVIANTLFTLHVSRPCSCLAGGFSTRVKIKVCLTEKFLHFFVDICSEIWSSLTKQSQSGHHRPSY